MKISSVIRAFEKLWQKVQERARFLMLPYGQIAYAQNAEDLVLAKFLDSRLKDKHYRGFYVDIGAHHPFRYSNTYYFYQRGWSGINIDADARALQLLNFWRARDTNLQALVGQASPKKNQALPYYIFSDHAFNTSDTQLAKELVDSGRAQLVKTEQLTPQTLSKLLAKHMPKNQQIDFMSIDVEGLDLAVLQSNDFQRFRPRFLLVEDLAAQSLKNQAQSKKISLFLEKQAYTLVSRVFNTAIWRDNRSLELF